MFKHGFQYKLARGFNLIELMVAVTIIGILAAIALPTYQKHVMQGKRSAAQAQMMDIANREQQYLLANRSYADKAALETNGYALPSSLSSSYTYDVVPGTGTTPSFLITFTATGSQVSDGDLTLDNNGTKTPSTKW